MGRRGAARRRPSEDSWWENSEKADSGNGNHAIVAYSLWARATNVGEERDAEGGKGGYLARPAGFFSRGMTVTLLAAFGLLILTIHASSRLRLKRQRLP